MVSTRQGIFSTIVGTIISLFNALIQFLTIYWVLEKFGSEFNGYVRLVSSFSALIATADGALGLATTILLVKPIVQNDWITANEIYSTSKKNYRKASYVGLTLVLLTSLAYPLYAGTSNTGLFEADSWKNIGISLGTEGELAGYWVLMGVSLAFGLKNFLAAFWFSVYENIIAADNKNTIRRIVILFTDIFVYGLLFYLLSLDVSPVIPFLSMLLYSPIKGLLIMLYVKRKYLWLKYYKEFNSFRLVTTKKKISFSSIGTSILVNTDVLIASIILGLSVSSTLSLYLVIAVNTRLIMTNFITSFREFFVALVAKRGRIQWESYAKYELYTYLVAGFTFINMSILSPYFVSALYGDLAINNLASTSEADRNVLEFMFFSPYFSILYAGSTALIILCEAQITLIHAKGRYGEVSKWQNYLGVTYIIVGTLATFICRVAGVGGVEWSLVSGIVAMYGFKLIFLVIRYCYLWVYVWKYATYNSTFKHAANNFMILLAPALFMSLFNIFYITKKLNIELTATKSINENAVVAPLIGLFFAIIAISGLVLILFAYLFSPKMMNGIMKNIPIINKIVNKKSEEARRKRFEEYGIDVDEITTDKSNQLSQALINIAEESAAAHLSLDTVEVKVEQKNDKVYVIKGS
ncbi:hypothetical protein SCHIN_v1c01550 [Spiroplasma chinense]|uniref:Uncharacterized protein n=1 Tax=Spiroplasma chinense TaxID=216932 RepID=A0A5B9Y3L5_9MOLU|nr:hypothetical protein [Spiroplasma chinense]QEH61353.1 hypothetical protein SCHIN_v1c01550 [Spiroplasma chinense]